ncbi:MAG: hypothetical protein AB1540_10880 [Bdellovibrionota bacterium]
MKYFILTAFLIVVFTVNSVSAAPPKRRVFRPGEAPVEISIEDVVERLKTENFTVYENALRVYQTKEAIEIARGNLLPKLNLWRIASVVVDPLSIVGVIEDIAPFLVPNNWFRLEEAKILNLAQAEAYRALWANELMTAKALYFRLLFDRALLEHIKQTATELEDLHLIIKSREELGGAPQGASRDIEVRMLSLQEDRRALEMLLLEEQNLLSHMMDLSADELVTPVAVKLPKFEDLKPLKVSEFEARVLATSPEIKQFEHLISAADYVKNEAAFSFLGASSVSRSVAGGIFDSLPVQNGLGFGTPASMRIVSAQKEILESQKNGIFETVRRQLKLLVNGYNLDIENYANLERRQDLTRASIEQLFERMRLGQDVEMRLLVESCRDHMQASTAFLAVKFRFLANEDRFSRLTFLGDYARSPDYMGQLKKTKSLDRH